MKIQVRRGVFETNSSSTHSLTMCSQSDYDRWNNGELLLNESWGTNLKGTFVSKEDAIKALITKGYLQEGETDEDIINEELRDNSFYTLDEYGDEYGDDYEWFSDDYITENGDKVVAFGYYGYDN